MSILSIAALQLELENANNLQRIKAEIDAVVTRFPWVRMVITGELSGFGFNREAACELPGEPEQFFCDLAARHGIWLIPGSLYEKRGDDIFNTLSVLDPDGSVVARYQKMFPFFPCEMGVTPGSEFVVFDIPGVCKCGVSICYDGWFPETTRALACMGAEVILHPTLTNTIDRDAELAIARASAVSNQCFFVDVNAAGRLGNGRSIVAGPGGDVIYQAGESREIIALQLDLQYLRRVREEGWHGLGQPLKSFRDSQVRFPQYGGESIDPMRLSDLGTLQKPSK